jgi:hypothetical protein
MAPVNRPQRGEVAALSALAAEVASMALAENSDMAACSRSPSGSVMAVTNRGAGNVVAAAVMQWLKSLAPISSVSGLRHQAYVSS